jgi:hypothetical protein
VGNTELMSKTGRASRLNTQGTIEELGAVAPAEWRQRMGVQAQAQTKKKIKSLLTRPTSLEMYRMYRKWLSKKPSKGWHKCL